MENIIEEILHKENITFENIAKATSGFTNLVYFVDDKYVIKMSKYELIKKKLDKEISIYKNIKMSCIPSFVASGSLQEYQYLIITKLEGKSLYSIWHTLSYVERQSCINKIANILKEFNKQDSEFLSIEYKDLNWLEYIKTQIITKLTTLKEMRFNVDEYIAFVNNNLAKLFEENKFGLVYNDAHFDNFIYNNGELSLIDFDRVRVCPIDYEMLIFKSMCDNPSKFASEEDEDKIKNEDYEGIYEQFKLEYPEMFKDKNIEKRIAIYQFNYLIGQAIKCKDNVWINKLLLEFGAKFNI